jgi:hypothetical protein
MQFPMNRVTDTLMTTTTILLLVAVVVLWQQQMIMMNKHDMWSERSPSTVPFSEHEHTNYTSKYSYKDNIQNTATST